jgi:hypothetical protein
MRQLLIDAAQDLERGIDPPGLDTDFDFTTLRSTEKIIEPGEDWRKLATPDDPAYAELLAKGRMPVTGLAPAGALTS